MKFRYLEVTGTYDELIVVLNKYGNDGWDMVFLSINKESNQFNAIVKKIGKK